MECWNIGEIRRMKMVSIIVPVYNAEKNLRRCVESLLEQSYSNIEILLVDDGAKDSSPRICDEFAQIDERVKVIHKENGGVSSARNMGLKKAKGQYIQFVDSDDWVARDYTEKLVAGIEKNSSELVIGGMIFVHDQIQEVRSLKECSIKQKEVWERQFGFLYKEYYLNSVWNKLFLKDKIVEFFQEEISLGEDCCFVLSYLRNVSEIQLITDYGYYFQMGSPDSLTKQCNMREFENAKLLYEQARSYAVETFGKFVGKEEISYILLQDLRRLLVQINNQRIWNKQEKITYLKQFASDPVFLGMKDEITRLGINQKILFGLLRKRYFRLMLLMMKFAWRD